jgi:apolipoprotein N-acyltransferase
VIASLPLGVEGVLDAPLPQPIAPTAYARLGDVPAWIMVFGALAWVILVRRRHRGG